MTEVLVSKSSLDFHREVIIHTQHSESHLILVIAVRNTIADNTPKEDGEFASIETISLHVVGVPDSAGEKNTSSAANIAEVLVQSNAVDILLHLRVEFVAKSLMLSNVVLEHTQEEVSVHGVLDNFTTGKALAEDALTDRCRGEPALIECFEHI